MAQAVGRFDSLCKLILKFPELASSAKFIFVPGPQDPGAGDTLPRPPVRREEKKKQTRMRSGGHVHMGRHGGSDGKEKVVHVVPGSLITGGSN